MKTLTLSLALLCLASCTTNVYEETPAEPTTKKVTFTIDQLDINKETRATLADEKLTELYIVDRVGTTVVQTIKKISTDADFATPSIDLTLGTHKIMFIAHRSEGGTLSTTDWTWTATKNRDTYAKELELTVTSSTSSQQVQLKRKNYKLRFLMTDAIPSTVATARVTISTYHEGLNLADFSGTTATSKSIDFNISSLQGTSNNDVSVYGFCAADGTEYTSNVTISFLKSDGTTVVTTHTKNAVPLETNCVTTISGNYFTLTPTLTMSVDNTYGTAKDVNL